jgi:hypothetical protein
MIQKYVMDVFIHFTLINLIDNAINNILNNSINIVYMQIQLDVLIVATDIKFNLTHKIQA